MIKETITTQLPTMEIPEIIPATPVIQITVPEIPAAQITIPVEVEIPEVAAQVAANPVEEAQEEVHAQAAADPVEEVLQAEAEHHKIQQVIRLLREVYHGKEMLRDGGLKMLTVHIRKMSGSRLITAGTSLILRAICLQDGLI